MPTAVARFHPGRKAWVVTTSNGLELEARDAADVEALVRKHLPGTAIRWDRTA